MPDSTPLVGPSDFPKLVVEFHRGKPDNKTANLLAEKEANASLLWQRYMPARDYVSKKMRRDGKSPFGMDLKECIEQLSNRDRRTSSNAKKNHLSFESAWPGLGIINWFIECANQVAKSSKNPDSILSIATGRRQQSLSQAQIKNFKTVTRCAVGLANSAPVENSGCCFHAVYGFPLIPGSAIKGMTRSWLYELGISKPMQGLEEFKTVKQLQGFLFGDSEDEQQGCGAVDFFDAWPSLVNDRWFDIDVLTPHHSQREGSQFALDSDTPNPIHFLTIATGVNFSIPIGISQYGRTLSEYKQKAALREANRLMSEALADAGVGARTKYGLGRMKEVAT